MSAPLLQSFAGQDADLQAQLSRQFRENLARNPDAMAAYLKATGGQTPAESPSALRAFQTEQSAATRRANQLAAGRAAVEERKALQAMTQPRPSGLMQSQVEELPGGFKAVYDRGGRLVGTNVPVQVKADAATKSPGEFMDAVDRAAFNRGEGTAAEQAALYPAMETAVREQRADTVRPRQATKEGAVQQALDTLDKYPPPVRPTGTAFPPSLVDALTQVAIPDYRASASAVPPETPNPLARFEDQMGEFYGTAPVPPSDPFLRSEYRTGSEWTASGPRYGSPETGKAGPPPRPQAPSAPIASLAPDSQTESQRYLDSLRQVAALSAQWRAAQARAAEPPPSIPPRPALFNQGLFPDLATAATMSGLGVYDFLANVLSPTGEFLFGMERAPTSTERETFVRRKTQG
jgi:hypothetical protein